MEILYLGIVFLMIIAVLALRHPLHHAILAGLAAIVVLYRITRTELREMFVSVWWWRRIIIISRWEN